MLSSFKFLIPGILVGAAISLFLGGPLSGLEIHPEWTGSLKSVEKIETSRFKSVPDIRFPVRTADGYYLLSSNGGVYAHSPIRDSFFTMSGNGRYYITFQKVGHAVEFYDHRGEGYWKLKSLEYPYMSRSGKLVLLLNGDHSRIRFFDLNGNEIGDKQVSGRMCTVISFSEKNDFGAVGFLTGAYYIISPKGAILVRGQVPDGTIVKSIAVGNNGAYAAVHYGSTGGDVLRIVEVKDGDFDEVKLKGVHQVKTSMHVSEEGRVMIIDTESLACFKPSGRERFRIRDPPEAFGDIGDLPGQKHLLGRLYKVQR